MSLLNLSTGENMKDGGPAFPVLGMSRIGDQGIHQVFSGGMTLRDYFAAKAMQGIIANATCLGVAKEVADDAYIVADAMLAERDKPTVPD